MFSSTLAISLYTIKAASKLIKDLHIDVDRAHTDVRRNEEKNTVELVILNKVIGGMDRQQAHEEAKSQYQPVNCDLAGRSVEQCEEYVAHLRARIS